MDSKLIVMLTHHDRTVPNALEVFGACKDLAVDFWGFKDVGLAQGDMGTLVDGMKAAGKQTFLEVVSYSEEECMRGARLAAGMGFDYLMGTVYHESVLEYIRAQGIKYLPFCGKVWGSPSVLEGSIPEIIEDARFLLSQEGVYGIDLLAYRHEDGEGLARAYCAAVKKPVVIAGSIDSRARLDLLHGIKPWAFTMGSALFDAKFVPGGDVRENLAEVVAYMGSME
jgi:hypothetical protein